MYQPYIENATALSDIMRTPTLINFPRSHCTCGVITISNCRSYFCGISKAHISLDRLQQFPINNYNYEVLGNDARTIAI